MDRRQCKAIESGENTGHCSKIELITVLCPTEQVNGPFGHNETNSTPNPDRGKTLLYIKIIFTEQTVRHRITQGNCRHIETADCEYGPIHISRIGNGAGIIKGEAAKDMTDPQDNFGPDILIGQYPQQSWHK